MENAADDLPPQAFRLAPKLRAVADRDVFFETSSWKYEGWLGSICTVSRYLTRNKFSKAKFERACLEEYAQTFPTVCGDLTFYQFPSDQYWAKLFDATPKQFVFGFKVPEDITVETWPKHARYRRRSGLANKHFLDAQTLEQFFTRRLVESTVSTVNSPHHGLLRGSRRCILDIYRRAAFHRMPLPKQSDWSYPPLEHRTDPFKR